MEIGPFTYHSLTGSDGRSVNGTSQRIGSFTYHSLRSDDGGTTTGTSTGIGSYTYHRLDTRDPSEGLDSSGYELPDLDSWMDIDLDDD